MKNLELNKIAASVLFAGIIAMLMSFITEAIYRPNKDIAQRGYEIEGANELSTNDAPANEEFQFPEFDIATLMQQADAENGAKLFKKCATCHSVNQGGSHKVGPNLWNVTFAKIGHYDDYNYSSSLKSMDGQWDMNSLFKFIYAPKKFIKGTKMGFAGIKKEQQIADIISYLQQYSK